ncbi:hypothetical protein U0070_016464 [Myodes glareolus]|uniref:Uncharacterized protein n=1 Tax=Myodes glareolus TaxID=447135 RepID=A0AAW0JZ28_MYOGA
MISGETESELSEQITDYKQTRFTTFATIGNYNGHASLDAKCFKKVATDIGDHYFGILGIAIFSASIPKKLLLVAIKDDYYTATRGCTATLGSFAKVTFDVIFKIYSYLTTGLRKETKFTKSYGDFTARINTRVSIQRA